MSQLDIRPLSVGEESLFDTFQHVPVHGVGMEHRRTYADFLARREYRTEWTWVALRDGVVVARAAWWGGPEDEHPYALDWFDPGTGPDRVEVGARLVCAALEVLRNEDGERPEYDLFLPVGWRDDPAARAAADDRLTAAEKAGLETFVERFSYRWAPSDGLPTRSTRLAFGPATDDAVVLDVLRRILGGTLDAYSGRDVAREGVDRAAEIQLMQLTEWLPGPRSWWRLARDADGSQVGLVVPSRNHAMPVIGYVGVLPEARGHGYVHDLLAEGTAILAAEAGEDEEIAADTDLGNAPMAAAFARAGYRQTSIRIVLLPSTP